MSLRDSLQIYKTNNAEDCKLLDYIFKKATNDYCKGAVNSHRINKILKAFENPDYVLNKFEKENEFIISDLKRYVMGARINSEKVHEIKSLMKCWALYFDGIGIEPSLKERIESRYRKNFLISYEKSNKKQLKKLLLLDYLFFIRNLNSFNEKERKEFIDNLKSENKIFLEYIIDSKNNIVFPANIADIDENYINNLGNEEFLLKTTKDIFNMFFKQFKYNNFEKDIKRIYFVQNGFNIWIDLNKLGDFIEENEIDLLKRANLIYEVKNEHIHIISLTEMGISIATNQFLKEWESDKYFYKFNDEVLIPFDSNPINIVRYLFDKTYTLMDEDFLLRFKII